MQNVSVIGQKSMEKVEEKKVLYKVAEKKSCELHFWISA